MVSRTLPRNALVKPRRRRAMSAIPGRWPHWRVWWPWIRRILTLLFFVLVIALMVRYTRNIDWRDVRDSLRDTPRPVLAAAVALAAASHLLYSCFDLIGRRYTGHDLPARAVMAVNFISYAFNLCLGSLVGAVGFRYRLYSRLGLDSSVITRILSMSVLTNWLGYKLLAGFLFVMHPLLLPPNWQIVTGSHGLQWLGVGLILVSLAYIGACAGLGNHVWNWRGHELYLPPWRMAGLQMTISCLNWCLMAGVIFVLLRQQVTYTDVLTVLLIGAIAGVAAHVPAGLGVFEFVFLAMLSHRVPPAQLLGALLGYRGIYYLAPLMAAALLYLAMEVHARQQARAKPGSSFSAGR